MITKQIPNGSYGDCLATGEYCYLIWDKEIHYSSGKVVSLGSGSNPMFLRINPVNPTEIAAKAHNGGNLLLCRDGVWDLRPLITGGNNPVIYSPDGVLISIPPHPNVGSPGFNYWDDEKDLPISYDESTNKIPGLAENVYLGKGIYVGQGLSGGLLVNDNGTLRVLDKDAAPFFIRKSVIGDKFGLYFIDGDNGKLIFGAIVELRSLPVYSPVTDNFGKTGPASPNGFLVSDTTIYVIGENNKPRNKTHLINQVEISENIFAEVKFGNSNAYELLAKTSKGIEYLEDASSDVVVTPTDTTWVPKSLKVGREYGVTVPEYDNVFRERSTCKEIRRDAFTEEIWLLGHYNQFDCGPDKGIVPTIAVVYDPTGGVHTAGRYIEINYYSLGIGRVRWESHKSWIVYATGKPVFSENSLAARSDFYLNALEKTQPNISGCAVLPVPPSNLKKPEVTVENWKPDATVDGWVFEGIDRENPGFGFKVWTENGSFYASFTNPVGSGRTGALRPYKKCTTVPPNPIPPNPDPNPGTISQIHISGETFRDSANNIFPYRFFTSFLLFKKYLEGIDISTYLKEWSSIGYNGLRVFSQVDWANGFLPKDYPNYNQGLIYFLNKCASHGMYVELVAHTFAYDVNEMRDHVRRLDSIIKNHNNVFLELANEPPVNGIDIVKLAQGFSFPYPWATGQYDPTSIPQGSYITTHTSRDSEWMRKAKWIFEYRDGGGPFDPNQLPCGCPVTADEPIGGWIANIPGRRSNVPDDFYIYGAGSQLFGAGGTYHHESGLNSNPPDKNGLEWECAKAFIKGMQLVLPAYQLGKYSRARDLSNPDDGGTGNCPISADNSLRTYGMTLGNLACVIRVHPTGPYIIDPNWTLTSIDSKQMILTLTRR